MRIIVKNVHISTPTIDERLSKIMATQVELAAALEALTAQMAKIGGETTSLVTKVQELTDALAAAGNTSPAVDAALAALQAQAGVVDGMVGDLPSVPPALPPDMPVMPLDTPTP